MPNPPPVITIDGPSGTGKGTIAHLLAARLGWHFLDSGALYRIVAYGAVQQAIALDDATELSQLALKMQVRFSSEFAGSITLDGKEISAQIRLEESGAKASVVAAIPAVRAALLQRQRDFRQLPGLVADGRDMGTVVFPDALVKFFLSASAEVRAERRYNQLINKGVDVSLRTLLRDIAARDARDSSRAVAPLVPAGDAILIDTSMLGVDEVFALIMAGVKAALPLAPL